MQRSSITLKRELAIFLQCFLDPRDLRCYGEIETSSKFLPGFERHLCKTSTASAPIRRLKGLAMLQFPCACVRSHFRHVQLFVTPRTVAHQAPLSMGFSRQGYQSGLPYPLQGVFLTQKSNPDLPHCRQILYYLSHLLRQQKILRLKTKRKRDGKYRKESKR